MLSDIEIARTTKIKPIWEIAKKLGLTQSDLDLYGDYKAKIKTSTVKRVTKNYKKGNLILVSAMTPTPAGEGKTTTTIGLGQAFSILGKNVSIVLREPSLGPTMGIKGGATGGGLSQVIPMDEINLHFTGDIHAVSTAHNLIAAVLDNHIYHGNKLSIDPRRIVWKRVIDMNDRALRNIVIGLGGTNQGVPRESGFDISAASEIMAILCLAEDLEDLEYRIGKILVALTYNDKPVTVKDLKIEGAVTSLLKDAINPNLVQTLEGVPAFIHGGPFANIAQGTNSVIATKTSLSLSDYTITEAGFGFDLGAEKFFDIKCVSGDLSPQLVILVASVRALKMHGGVALNNTDVPNAAAVKKGLSNLQKHVENIKKFNMPSIVAINRFTTDTNEELDTIKNFCSNMCTSVVINESWARGGAGAVELARTAVEIIDKETVKFTPIYNWNDTVENKIYKIATEIYGATHIDYTKRAKKDLSLIHAFGMDNLPICIAKTQKSLSDNPELLGRPEHFIVTVRQIGIDAGAGFLVPVTGNILRMPGLPAVPAATKIKIDKNGNIGGLS